LRRRHALFGLVAGNRLLIWLHSNGRHLDRCLLRRGLLVLWRTSTLGFLRGRLGRIGFGRRGMRGLNRLKDLIFVQDRDDVIALGRLVAEPFFSLNIVVQMVRRDMRGNLSRMW
jgi:hypothetical protein